MIFAKRRNGAPRHFRRACDKKVGALGLAALLGAPDQALLPELSSALPQLLAGLIRLLTALKAQQARTYIAFSPSAPPRCSLSSRMPEGHFKLA